MTTRQDKTKEEDETLQLLTGIGYWKIQYTEQSYR